MSEPNIDKKTPVCVTGATGHVAGWLVRRLLEHQPHSDSKTQAELFGPMMDDTLSRKVISRNVGYPWKADNTKSVETLGMKYRPLSETMNDFFAQLVEAGEVKAA